MYATIDGDQVTWFGPLPDELSGSTPEEIEAAGYMEILEPPKPDDTPTVTYFSTYRVVDGRPTRYWQSRERTPEEVLFEQARTQHESDRALVKAIITDLRAEKDRAQAVIDDAAATRNEKNLGRAAKRIADAAIDLARFVKDS